MRPPTENASRNTKPLDALIQAIIDDKECFNHLKCTSMTNSTINVRVYINCSPVKRKKLYKERFNSSMKCGNAFTKCHRNIFRAKEQI